MEVHATATLSQYDEEQRGARQSAGDANRHDAPADSSRPAAEGSMAASQPVLIPRTAAGTRSATIIHPAGTRRTLASAPWAPESSEARADVGCPSVDARW
jgi:hypothetical protein